MSDHQHLTRFSPSTGPKSPDVWGIYEAATGSIQYVAACPRTRRAALIDVVLDFQTSAARSSTASAEAVLSLVEAERLQPAIILDTHPHADHLSAAGWLKDRTGLPKGIGKKVREIAGLWRDLYNDATLDPEPHFDHLFAHGDRYALGELELEVVLTPGHTLGSVSYFAGDAGLVADTLMYPDSGSSRADFPGGSAAELWDSIRTILERPECTRLFVGHDYGKGGRAPQWEATVARHRAENIHVQDGIDRETFIATREARDTTLALPERMLHALQVNLRGGDLPPPESDGNSYFKVPANRF